MLNFLKDKYFRAFKLSLTPESRNVVSMWDGNIISQLIILLATLLLHGSGMLKDSRPWFFLLGKCGVTYIT